MLWFLISAGLTGAIMVFMHTLLFSPRLLRQFPPRVLLRFLPLALGALLSLSLLPLSAMARAQDGGNFVPGRDYHVIDPALPVRVAPGKVEVIEFFNFSCPHCFRIQRPFYQWQKERDMSDVEITRVPVAFQQTGGHYARAYYTMESLGAADDLYGKMFGAIHREHKLLNSKGRFLDWLEEQGYDAAKAEAAYDSFSVNLKTAKTADTVASYGVSGTPTFAVGGKYVIDAGLAGSRERMITILSVLVAAEQKAQKEQ